MRIMAFQKSDCSFFRPRGPHRFSHLQNSEQDRKSNPCRAGMAPTSIKHFESSRLLCQQLFTKSFVYRHFIFIESYQRNAVQKAMHTGDGLSNCHDTHESNDTHWIPLVGPVTPNVRRGIDKKLWALFCSIVSVVTPDDLSLPVWLQTPDKKGRGRSVRAMFMW